VAVHEIAVAATVAAMKKSNLPAVMKSAGLTKSLMMTLRPFAPKDQAEQMPVEMRLLEETTVATVREVDADASHVETRHREIQHRETRHRVRKVGARPCVMSQGEKPLQRAKFNGANPFEKMRGETRRDAIRLLAKQRDVQTALKTYQRQTVLADPDAVVSVNK